MIETEQTVTIDAGIKQVWDYAHDINKWASLMPGLQACTIIDADNSHWTLKVGAGGLVRTVKVRVHVTEWAGPTRATFTYKLEGDPVEGGGSYTATSRGAHATDVTLSVRVEGKGPMAPMWEAMGKPLLPSFAKAFAEQLKAKIEESVGAPAASAESPSFFANIWQSLRRWWHAAFGATAS